MSLVMSPVTVPLAFFGLPSVQSIVEGIVSFFFQDVARALVPDFLRDASVSTIKWLVAVPDPSVWTHVGALEADMSYLAVSLLGVSFTAALVRYLLVGLTGAGHPLQALSSTVVSAGMLVGYPWAASQVVAMVNTLTDSVLSLPVVGAGLQRTVGVMFGGALLVGSGGVFLAVLVVVGVVFAAVMFALKVFVLLAFALLYVTGPLVIAVRPLPELSHLARAWGTALIGVALVPFGWTVLFAVAGALSLDATTFGGGGAAGLSGHVAGAFAALLTFFLALKLPLGVFSHLRGAFGGIGGGGTGGLGGGGTGGLGGGGTGDGGAGSGGGGGITRVADAHARLRAGTLQAGRSFGLAAGAFGAPAGGAVGAAGRLLGRAGGGPVGAAARAGGSLSGPLVAGASVAVGAARGRLSSRRGRPGAAAGEGRGPEKRRGQVRAGRVAGVRERLARAGRTLGEVPRRVRAGAAGFARPERAAGGGQARAGSAASAGQARTGGATAAEPAGTDARTQRRQFGDGASRPQPPRPPQRSARAGEGDARASSATARGGASDGTPRSRSSEVVRAGGAVSPGPGGQGARPGAIRREEKLAADSRSRREGSRVGGAKPPAVGAAPDRGGRLPGGGGQGGGGGGRGSNARSEKGGGPRPEATPSRAPQGQAPPRRAKDAPSPRRSPSAPASPSALSPSPAPAPRRPSRLRFKRPSGKE